jgi:glycosyltransferase involved in cell wall biosynthesis
MSLPRLSVIIPNYNHARELPRSLDAILAQSVLPTEILVMDDASTDHSLEVLDAYARRSPLLRVHRGERNHGVCAVMNRGLELAAGDFVSFPAADDEVLPGWLERSLGELARHPQAGIVSGLTEWRCQKTGMRWEVGTRMPSLPVYLNPDEMVKLGQAGRLAISGQHALIRRSALLAAGGWLSDLRWFTDWFGNFVVGFRHGIIHIPQVFSVFYLYPTSYYNSPEAATRRRETMSRILEYLDSDKYADVAPLIRRSGLLGGFGLPMLREILRQRSHRKYLTTGFLKQAGRRTAEITGRRFFPGWLARLCLRLFYKRS